MNRWGGLVIPAIVVVVLSISLWWALGIDQFLFEDACLDRGGKVEAGRCIGASVQSNQVLLYLIQFLVAPVVPLIGIVWWWRRGRRMDDV